MKNINSPSSTKKEARQSTPNTQIDCNDSSVLFISDDLIDHTIKETGHKNPTKTYKRQLSKGKRRSAYKCQPCTIIDLEFSSKVSEVDNGYRSHCSDQFLVGDNEKLRTEVDRFKKDNKILKDENTYLKGCLGNLKAQFNHLCNGYYQLEDLVHKFKIENGYIHQKLAFSEQKLDEYVALAFNQENKIQNLECDLTSIKSKFEAKICALKLREFKTSSLLSKLKPEFQTQVQTLNSSVIVGKPKPQILQLDKLNYRLSKLNLFISETMDCLHHLFRDKWSESNWKRAQTLFNDYTNSFMTGWIDVANLWL